MLNDHVREAALNNLFLFFSHASETKWPNSSHGSKRIFVAFCCVYNPTTPFHTIPKQAERALRNRNRNFANSHCVIAEKKNYLYHGPWQTIFRFQSSKCSSRRMSTKYFRMDPFACGSNVWSVFRTEFLSYINTTAPHTLHMIKTQCSSTSAVRTGTTDYRNETLTICYRLFLLSLSLYITQMLLQKLQLWWLIVAKTRTNPTAWYPANLSSLYFCGGMSDVLLKNAKINYCITAFVVFNRANISQNNQPSIFLWGCSFCMMDSGGIEISGKEVHIRSLVRNGNSKLHETANTENPIFQTSNY